LLFKIFSPISKAREATIAQDFLKYPNLINATKSNHEYMAAMALIVSAGMAWYRQIFLFMPL
jgi:hypothetical protein